MDKFNFLSRGQPESLNLDKIDLLNFIQNITMLSRPSDRVRGCGTAQFGQTCTITHNSQKSTKSCTIVKYLVENLFKTGISIEY